MIDEQTLQQYNMIVPTYHSPEEVNAKADQAEEMNMQKEPVEV